MPTTRQLEYLRQNTVKDATIQSWMVVSFAHVDWPNDLNFVAIEQNRGVEFDESIYTFEGIQYTPVSMYIEFPRESDTSIGNATVNFARAATTLKRLMRSITPENSSQPISCEIKQYQSNLTSPVKSFSGFVAKDYPKISGQDISVKASRLNPALLTSDFIVTTDLYPELRQS